MEWTTDKVRSSFLNFFKERGHQIVPSASLVPKGDPTLLFTNAGMVQFKDYFLGIRTPEARRVADCQKCLRISGKHNDLEAVGRDTYHHTFFEMLGNWSFGDYYKAEAIQFHWELLTKVWRIDPALLYATVYKDDQEAEDAWIKMNVLPRERIMRFGEKENFWEMGETGPCGPCSEIHIDRGAEACDGSSHQGLAGGAKWNPETGEGDPEEKGGSHHALPCGVNVDGCARFIELGNLVFIQYNRDAAGVLTPLPMKHVDTGTGLERVAAVLQSFEVGRLLGNYDIDLFKTIIGKIEELVAARGRGRGWAKLAKTLEDRDALDMPLETLLPGNARYGQKFPDDERRFLQEQVDVSYRAIADHARAMCFLVAEGIVPGNTDREYVLRRIIRRAARHGRYLGIHVPFLADVAESVIATMGNPYPELRTEESRIKGVLTAEEERFSETLDRGLELIESERRRLSRGDDRVLPGEVAFKLYDTYGFPLDLTQDVLRDDRIEVDVAGFDRLMTEQRERGRAALREPASKLEPIQVGGLSTRFVGYDSSEFESDMEQVERVGDEILVVTRETPFYPEGGGQVGDRGIIELEDGGAVIEVTDTQKKHGQIVHVGRVLEGDANEIWRGRRAKLKVDRPRRDAAMLNHSATHILHYALRDVLGSHVHQAGSLVAPDRLRFDFAHTGSIAPGDLQTIEEEVNARIRENAPVIHEEMAHADALKTGALAFFGEKYGDRVRVVRMGDFSIELCGGTHVGRTGDIGVFKLEAESGVAAGVRRVEALTGQGALESIRRREEILREIGDQLRAKDGAALERLQRLLAREKELEKKIRALEQKLTAGGSASPDETVREVGGIKLVTRRLEGVEPGAMRGIADQIRSQHKSVVVALGSAVAADKVALLIAVTPDLVPKVKAGEIIKQIAPIVGGSGGGRPDFAQAGGRDPARLGEALDKVSSLLSGI